MSLDRRRFIRGVGTAGALALAGCTGNGDGDGDGGDGSGGDGGDGGGDGTSGDGGDGGDDTTNVGMVYAAGGLGDGSFNDQAQEGIEQAADEFGIEYRESQPESPSEFGNFQRQFARETDPDYDLVCCIGFLQADPLSDTASEYPDQQFMIVDETVDADNVASYVFAEHEGSFLVGHLAGALTTMDFEAGAGATTGDSTNVGFVGGVESPLIKRFEAGFVAGAAHANEDVDVQTAYVGGFDDPSGGKEAALSMYDSGSDIVYHAAGNTGTGVFQAAQEEGKFAIGVDRDQSVTRESFSDVILASMVKRVDTAVYNSVEATVDGSLEGGSTTALGLEDDGVAAVYGDQLGSEIPQDVKDAIGEARQGIIDGEIDVPEEP
ncbi:BMP family lipoprotein [Halosimplex salinum]|uniref:BMP family lipoprotein n=1 Tax=Halosimplex salinum TaxID=1710538 RepID=UPI000F4A5F9D|nr:BMP family protein [Halosimplex salinum]